jgi:16S rRNA (guanine527-N7)-methyltransferase
MGADVKEIALGALGYLPPELGTDAAATRLERFLELLFETNPKINLVSRRDTPTHVARFTRECAYLVRLLHEDLPRVGPRARVLDLGTGGGFPGLVVKLLLPAVEATLVEGTRKKALFLARACETLELSGIKVIWGRAEVLSDRRNPAYRRDLHHGFDWVTAKALGSITESVQLALPFLAEGGMHWTFKGAGFDQELQESRKLLRKSGLEVHRVDPIPDDESSYIISILNVTKSKSAP